MIREALTTIPSLTMVKETQKDNVPSASYPAYDLGWDKQAANPSCTLPPNPSNIHLLPYPIPHIQGHLRDEPSTYQSPPHANYSHYSVASTVPTLWMFCVVPKSETSSKPRSRLCRSIIVGSS